jgi:prophage antirepressor-like protein
MSQVVLFKIGDEAFPIEIIDHNGERWITRKQLGDALGVKDLSSLHLRLLRKNEIREGIHFAEFYFDSKGNSKGGNPNIIIYSYRGMIRMSMHSEGKRAKIFRDWAEDVLYEVMVTGSYHVAGKDTGNVVQIYNFSSLAHMAEEDSALEKMFRKRKKGLMQIGFDKSVAVRNAIASICKETGIDLAKRWGFDAAEIRKTETPEPEYKNTSPEPEKVHMLSSAPSIYRGWNLNRRGKNKNGEDLFNLVRKVRGKRHQKYLGAWNQEKADKLIDELNRTCGISDKTD